MVDVKDKVISYADLIKRYAKQFGVEVKNG